MTQLDNSGEGQLEVPGFGSVPLVFQLPCEDRFTHGIEEWSQTPAVTLREFAMTAAMDRVTDQDSWHRGVCDDARMAEWKRDAMAASPLISEKTWEWCVLELQDKAKFFVDKGFVETLDAGTVVCKSNTLLPPDAFTKRFQRALAPLQAANTSMVGHLVDPCLYPLVYGQTEVLAEGGRTTINLQDLNAGLYPTVHKLTPAPQPSVPDGLRTAQRLHEAESQMASSEDADTHSELLPGEALPDPFYWSSRYQSLPCEVSFTSEGVSILSYVNNLHPSFKEAYSCLEDLIAASIEPWNRCICVGRQNMRLGEPADYPESCINDWDQTQKGRKPLRIITFGVQWVGGLPSWAIAFDPVIKQELEKFQKNPAFVAARRETRPFHLECSRSAYEAAILQLDPIPEPDQKTFEEAWAYLGYQVEMYRCSDATDPNWNRYIGYIDACLKEKANATRRWLHPEPGTVLSYGDWKRGLNVDKAIVEMDHRASSIETMPSGPKHTLQHLRIQDEFHNRGLQVIVEIGSIDLDPASSPIQEQPWQLQGLSNEHIVATSLYVYDLSNVVASIAFRQETPINYDIYRDDVLRAPTWVREPSASGTDIFHQRNGNDMQAICSVFGIPEEGLDSWQAAEYPPLYETGQIKLTQGRLVAFPNVLESRKVAELIDKTIPGRLAYVNLSLVDPHYRICSTANVPPQQPHWKADPESSVKELSSAKTRGIDDGSWTDHERNMAKERQWLNDDRHQRMHRLDWSNL